MATLYPFDYEILILKKIMLGNISIVFGITNSFEIFSILSITLSKASDEEFK